MSAANARTSDNYIDAYCPDPYCYERLCVPQVDKSDRVCCFFCGQTFPIDRLASLRSTDDEEASHVLGRSRRIPSRKRDEWIRVNGVSAFHCKMVSHLFYTFGGDDVDDEESKQGRRLFSFKLFADCAFAIDELDMMTFGYKTYNDVQIHLMDTLSLIKDQNNFVDVLLPMSMSGNGNGLLESVSTALVGNDMFWYPLYERLMQNLIENENRYRGCLSAFAVDQDLWEKVKGGVTNTNDHRLDFQRVRLFALANVLRRPIILLDYSENYKLSGEFCAIFLPLFCSVDECKNENGVLNKPLVLAWANRRHDSFVPLVAIRGRPLPKMSATFLPKAWCASNDQLQLYISFVDKCCNVACGRMCTKSDSRCAIDEIDKKYLETYGVHPGVACDYFESFENKDYDESVLTELGELEASLLTRCLVCWRLTPLPDAIGEATGFDLVRRTIKEKLEHGKIYESKLGKYQYDDVKKLFTIIELYSCLCCRSGKKPLRRQTVKGRIFYEDGDHTRIPAPMSKCKRKMKHFLNGNLVDDLPEWFKNTREIFCNDAFWLVFGDSNLFINRTDPANVSITGEKQMDESSPFKLPQSKHEIGYKFTLPVLFENREENILFCKAGVTEEELKTEICQQFSLKLWQIKHIHYTSFNDFDTYIRFPKNLDGIRLFVHRWGVRPEVIFTRTVQSLSDLIKLFEQSLGSNYFWNSIENRPSLFRQNGFIYDIILRTKSLTDSCHYNFPALPNIIFVFCGKNNTFELCVRNVGHFEVDETLRERMAACRNATNEVSIEKAFKDFNEKVQRSFFKFTNVIRIKIVPDCAIKKF